MKIYHLELEVKIRDDCTYISKVFSTLDNALEYGKKTLKYNFLVKYRKYAINEKDITLEKIIGLRVTSYGFTITEFDPYEVESREIPGEKEKLVLEEPTHIKYFFNFDGSLKFRKAIYINSAYEELLSFNIFDSDLEEDAGSKFKVGDFVKRKNSSKDRIYTVKETPIKLAGQKYFDNSYLLSFSNGNGERVQRIYECELEKYEQ